MFSLALTLTLLQAAPLSRAERAIAAHVQANGQSAVALLERVVNINSGTLNLPGVRRVGEVFKAEFDRLGFSTRWVDGAPFGRAGHLIAERRGRGPRLLLIGHLDTVFEQSSPFQRMTWIDSTRAKGPGIVDMKGGDVIIVKALEALGAAGLLDDLDLTVIFTGDEEDPGDPVSLARASLLELARRADMAIGFENGSGDPHKAVIARRGFTGWTLTVTGKPAHSSQIFRPENGSGAIFEAARILDAFHQRLAGQPFLTFNPGLALGGTQVAVDTTGLHGTAMGKTNIVAERMVVKGDLRILSADQLESTKRTMREIVAANQPQTSARIDFEDGYPPLPPAPGNGTLLEIYDQASRDLGFGPVTATDPMRAGAADVSFTAGLVPMAIDGIGAAGANDHTADETADLAVFPTLITRAAIFLHRLGQTKPRA
ncbi:MAG: M20 family metallopeptidase [Gemmatimonadetes bacterium]|nr:M20 family metallopeptidase [Gemmatimonadota bacterium]